MKLRKFAQSGYGWAVISAGIIRPVEGTPDLPLLSITMTAETSRGPEGPGLGVQWTILGIMFGVRFNWFRWAWR